MCRNIEVVSGEMKQGKAVFFFWMDNVLTMRKMDRDKVYQLRELLPVHCTRLERGKVKSHPTTSTLTTRSSTLHRQESCKGEVRV